MKNILVKALLVTALSVPGVAESSELKGLNVLMTSPDAQTQMMGMVLSGSVIKDQKKQVSIVLCGPAGNLALKDSPAVSIKRPDGTVSSPKAALQGLIKAGATVSVCPLFLPNAGKETGDLSEGITIAKPPAVAAGLTNSSYSNTSF